MSLRCLVVWEQQATASVFRVRKGSCLLRVEVSGKTWTSERRGFEMGW